MTRPALVQPLEYMGRDHASYLVGASRRRQRCV